MTKKPVWKQITPRHFAMEGAPRCIELRYESAGFLSAWGVYADGAVVHRHPGFMEARGVAATLAAA